MKMISFAILTFWMVVHLAGCTKLEIPDQQALRDNNFDAGDVPDLPLKNINLPDGFNISVFASVHNARSLTMSPSGVIFVGNRSGNKVYALKDVDGDHVADKKYIIDKGLRSPNGVAFHEGDLYVAEISRILKYESIEDHLENPPKPVVIYEKYPKNGHHGWKYIAFGTDGKLYVPVGAPCNICERPDNEVYASITRINKDGSDMEVFVKGVRMSVGFTWHPETGEMWFTDNGRDMLGDNKPPCELNYAPEQGMHFGYPYCHGGTIPDPEFGKNRACSEFVPPAIALGPHVAPLGLKFYTGNQFPELYRNQIFIAEHGSWNRSKKIGYRITLVTLEGNQATGYSVFSDGWLNDTTQSQWGRPVDILVLPDGSLLVSDDYADVIYRISYTG